MKVETTCYQRRQRLKIKNLAFAKLKKGFKRENQKISIPKSNNKILTKMIKSFKISNKLNKMGSCSNQQDQF
jgi:hypothetical protein